METLNSFIRKYAELHSIPMTQARAEIERFESAFKEITVESGQSTNTDICIDTNASTPNAAPNPIISPTLYSN